MAMERETHENLLNELLDGDLQHSRRAEILQELRGDYTTVIEEDTKTKTQLEKLQLDNNDLILSNSKLFRQVGITTDSSLEKKENEKEFSETISLEELEA